MRARHILIAVIVGLILGACVFLILAPQLPEFESDPNRPSNPSYIGLPSICRALAVLH
jgi:hypothetical protein